MFISDSKSMGEVSYKQAEPKLFNQANILENMFTRAHAVYVRGAELTYVLSKQIGSLFCCQRRYCKVVGFI
jgi:hypothetical protein